MTEAQIEDRRFHLIVEQHANGFVAWPIGLRGAVAGQGDTAAAAIADATSAIRFHIETFGDDARVIPAQSLPPRRRGAGIQ